MQQVRQATGEKPPYFTCKYMWRYEGSSHVGATEGHTAWGGLKPLDVMLRAPNTCRRTYAS